jgi:hypothetical protein
MLKASPINDSGPMISDELWREPHTGVSTHRLSPSPMHPSGGRGRRIGKEFYPSSFRHFFSTFFSALFSRFFKLETRPLDDVIHVYLFENKPVIEMRSQEAV